MFYLKDRMRAGCAAFLLGWSAVLAGCSEGSGPEAAFPQGVEVDVLSQAGGAEGKEPLSQGSGTGRDSGIDRKAPSAQDGAETLRTSQSAGQRVSLEEPPSFVFRTGDGHLLLLGDGVSLMNVNTLEMDLVRKETGLDFSFRDFHSCKAVTVGDEYLVLGNYLKMKDLGNGMASSDGQPQLKLVRFDKNLNVLETRDMGEVMGAKREIDKYGFLDGGTKLFCASLAEVFLYDLKTGKRTEYPLIEGKLNGVYYFGCIESVGKIVFVSPYDDGSRDCQQVLGSISLDGTDLQYETKERWEWGEIWGFDNFALLEDGKLHEHGEKGSAFYYGTDGKLKQYTLADEYAALQPSDTGKYFAVQSKDWTEDGKPTGYTVRVYESKSGRLAQEISCPFSEIGQDTMLWECIVSEEAGAVFLLMCDRETRGNARLQAVKLNG